MKLGRSRGVREERTDHTKIFPRVLAGSGLTWQQKVHISTFDGKLTFQCTRNSFQNPPFCPGSLQDTFVIYSSICHQHISRKYFAKRNNLVNRKYENMKIQKPSFTNRSPGGGDWGDTERGVESERMRPRVDEALAASCAVFDEPDCSSP